MRNQDESSYPLLRFHPVHGILIHNFDLCHFRYLITSIKKKKKEKEKSVKDFILDLVVVIKFNDNLS